MQPKKYIIGFTKEEKSEENDQGSTQQNSYKEYAHQKEKHRLVLRENDVMF